MAYKVRIENFEGPFDLLLYLVSRQKVDIGSISISQIADQYLEEIQRLKVLDLDVASDFLLVASTLLEIKAQSLLPKERDSLDEELAELDPQDARVLLIDRLLLYKQYKNAAEGLQKRFEEEQRRYPRTYGPDAPFLSLMPDFLSGITLERLGLLAATALARREVFLLESEHIAAKPIPVETFVESIQQKLERKRRLTFHELVAEDPEPERVVVTFLALLELYKRQLVTLVQDKPFGDISIVYLTIEENMQ